MKTKVTTSVLLFLGFFLFGSSCFSKVTYIHEPITQWLYKPTIWVNENLGVVWFEEDDPSTLTMFNDGFIFQLTNQRHPHSPIILNKSGCVAWPELDHRVFLFDGESVYPISDPLVYPVVTDINDRCQVVWRAYGESSIDIYYYDGKKTHQLTDTGRNVEPKISNNQRIAWLREDESGPGSNLFIYRKNKIQQVTFEGIYNDFVMSERGHFLLLGEDDQGTDVYYYFRKKVQQLTRNNLLNGFPAITRTGTGVWVGWTPIDSSTFEIYTYSSKKRKVIQLTDNDYEDGYYQVNDFGQIAWMGWAGSDWPWEIFLYNGHHTIRLTDNDTFDVQPRINVRGDVVWTHFTGPYTQSGELHFYDGSSITPLTHDNPIEISDIPLLINWLGEIVYRRENRDTEESMIYIAWPKKKSSQP